MAHESHGENGVYSVEPDLERFEVFIVGVLQWLSVSLLPGPDKDSTAMQLRYLGS